MTRRSQSRAVGSRWLHGALALLSIALAFPGCAEESSGSGGGRLPEGLFVEPPAQAIDAEHLPVRSRLEELDRAQPGDELVALGSTLGFSSPVPANDDAASGSVDLSASSSVSASSSDPAVAITPELRELAAQLGHDPVRIYEFVRNEIDFEPYFGSVKGAHETFLQRGGNDYDISSLLIALLRESGTEAEYARGVVQLELGEAMSWLGVQDPVSALEILGSAGIPGRVLVSGGRIVGFELEHVWVEVPGVPQRTQTQGGWGAAPHGRNPGVILAANFEALFPDGLLVGDRYDGSPDGGGSVRFRDAAAVAAALPAGGRPTALTFAGLRDGPIDTDQGSSVLLGQVVAATINLACSDRASIVDTLGTPPFRQGLGDLQLVPADSPLGGLKVEELVVLGNQVLGGAALPAGTSLGDVVDALTAVNEAFVDGGAGAHALDASFKLHAIHLGRNIYQEAGLDPAAVSDLLFETAGVVDLDAKLLNEINTDAIDELLRQRREAVLRYLDEHDPLVTLAELEGGQTILRETFTALPRENPLRVVSGVSRFAAIPQADREQIRVVGFGFDHTMELAAVSSSRINVGFEPATSDDA